MLKKVICLFTITIALLSSVAYGAQLEQLKANYDLKRKVVELSGNYVVGKTFSVLVMNNKGGLPVQPSEVSDEDISTVVKYTGEFKVTNQDGSFSFSFPLDADTTATGEYTVYLSQNSMADMAHTTFQYINPAEEQVALNAINTANSEDISALLIQYQDIINLDLSQYLSLGQDIPQADEILVRQRPLGGFSNSDELQQGIDCAVGLYYLNNAADKSELRTMLLQYGEACGLNMERYLALGAISYDEDITPEELSQQKQEQVCAAVLVGKPFLTATDFNTRFQTETAIADISTAAYWPDLQKMIIETYALELNISSSTLSSYDDINKKDSVFKAMLGHTYTDLISIRENFAKKVADILKAEVAEEEKTTTHHSGGGGSSNGVTSSYDTTFLEQVIAPAKAQFEEEPKAVFDDVSNVDWAMDAISYLAKNSIISGDGTGHFYPDRNVTREEFLKILVETFGEKEMTENLAFSDVRETDWFYQYVSRAVSANIVKGVSESTFGVGREITREEMAVMVYRAAALQPMKPDEGFSDISEFSDYSVEAVLTLKELGLINGVGNQQFAPNQNATRAQAAKLIYDVVMYGKE